MIPRIPVGMRLIALLGDPVDHSLSPVFQNAAFREAEIAGVYVALRCGAADFRGLLRGIAAAGGAGNVTVPHKRRAAVAVDVATDAVHRTGACNTFWYEDRRVFGDNTDVAGFRAAAAALLGGAPSGARVLLIGAGGAASAAAAGLAHDGADAVVVLNRTAARAADLARRFDGTGSRFTTRASAADLSGERFDLVVNATPAGGSGEDALPLPLDAPLAFGAALDLAYAPGGTAWVRALRTRGIPADDGLEMLIHQGAAAFERWWGRPAPLDAMHAALAPFRLPR